MHLRDLKRDPGQLQATKPCLKSLFLLCVYKSHCVQISWQIRDFVLLQSQETIVDYIVKLARQKRDKLENYENVLEKV